MIRFERRDRGGAPTRRSDYDQVHVLTAVLAWALPRGFEPGARMRDASGFPVLPVVGVQWDF